MFNGKAFDKKVVIVAGAGKAPVRPWPEHGVWGAVVGQGRADRATGGIAMSNTAHAPSNGADRTSKPLRHMPAPSPRFFV